MNVIVHVSDADSQLKRSRSEANDVVPRSVASASEGPSTANANVAGTRARCDGVTHPSPLYTPARNTCGSSTRHPTRPLLSTGWSAGGGSAWATSRSWRAAPSAQSSGIAVITPTAAAAPRADTARKAVAAASIRAAPRPIDGPVVLQVLRLAAAAVAELETLELLVCRRLRSSANAPNAPNESVVRAAGSMSATGVRVLSLFCWIVGQFIRSQCPSIEVGSVWRVFFGLADEGYQLDIMRTCFGPMLVRYC